SDDPLPRPNRADPANAALAIAELLFIDDELLLPVLPLDQPWRPVAKPRVDIGGPQIERLEDVTVGIDHVVGAGHRHFLRIEIRYCHPTAMDVAARPNFLNTVQFSTRPPCRNVTLLPPGPARRRGAACAATAAAARTG